MKSFRNYIFEKFIINKNTKVQSNFSDEELRDDYEKASGSYTKAEKLYFLNKYGIKSNKIREIEIEIAKLLRQNRKSKKPKDFTEQDFIDFFHFDPLDKNYKDYLEEESLDFVIYLYNFYHNRCKKFNYHPRTLHEKHQCKIIKIIIDYLQSKNIKATYGKPI